MRDERHHEASRILEIYAGFYLSKSSDQLQLTYSHVRNFAPLLVVRLHYPITVTSGFGT
jgi:hypothetical protein